MLAAVIGSVFGLAIGLAIGLGVGFALNRRAASRAVAAERRARSAERLAEIGSMTSGLAHEIKNPLSTIALNTQLLAEGLEEAVGEEDERQRLVRRAGTIERETERLRGILSDFLEFAGEKKVNPARADLNTLVDELADFFHPQAERQGVRVRTDLHTSELLAPLDAPLVKQALLNLMLNAVQAMEGDGADRATPSELILRTRPGKTHAGEPAACAHVIDTGPGIDDETRDRIFTPYYTTKPAGTGLGLPTTRRIVEEHGGEIHLHTTPGTGTDFELVFPVATASP